METEYNSEFDCFLPKNWDGNFPVWGFRYSSCRGVIKVQIFDSPSQRDQVLAAFNFQAKKLGLSTRARPEGERAVVYPNGWTILPELNCDNSLAHWIDEFVKNMVKLWPNQALTDFGLESIAVSHSSGMPFCLDWSSSIVGVNQVRREFPSPECYRLFLYQFGKFS